MEKYRLLRVRLEELHSNSPYLTTYHKGANQTVYHRDYFNLG